MPGNGICAALVQFVAGCDGQINGLGRRRRRVIKLTAVGVGKGKADGSITGCGCLVSVTSCNGRELHGQRPLQQSDGLCEGQTTPEQRAEFRHGPRFSARIADL